MISRISHNPCVDSPAVEKTATIWAVLVIAKTSLANPSGDTTVTIHQPCSKHSAALSVAGSKSHMRAGSAA